MTTFISPRSSRVVSYETELAGLIDRQNAIIDGAKQAARDLSKDESAEFNRNMARVELLQAQLRDADLRIAGNIGRRPLTAEWSDSQGRPVYALRPDQKLADIATDTSSHEEFSLGRVVRAIATGDRRFAQREFRGAMSESVDSGGGIMVPSQVSTRVIDLARARSVVIAAGATTIPMESDRITLARVSADPSFDTAKIENAAFSGSSPVFDAVNMTAYTLGQVVTISRELAADAPNIEQLVESILANALATKIDNLALNGTGSAEWSGLVTDGNIGSTGSVGGIAWEDLATGVVDVQGNNFSPTGYICHPTIAGDLAVLVSGDAANSAKMWLGPPPNVAPLTQFVSTNCALANLYIGQWDQFAFGVRQEALLEATTTGGNAFANHSVLVKITFRGSIVPLQSGAFHRLDGITS